MAEEDVGSADVEAVDVGEAVESAPVADSAPEAAPQQEVWGHFRSMPEFSGQDDNAIAQRLYQAMQREDASARALQQYQSIVPIAQEYLTHRQDYEAWKANRGVTPQQPQAPVAAAPVKESWWNPPALKDSYKRFLTRDESGNEVIDPNAPLDAKAALMEHQAYRSQFATNFLENPEKTLGPMVERVAIERAQEIVDERLKRMNDEQYVSGLEAENKDWLYDQNGSVSAEGLAVQKYIGDAKSLGISGAQARWDYATKLVERDLLLSNLQQSKQPVPQYQQAPQQVQQQVQQQPTAEQSNMEFLRQQAMRTASQRSVTTGTTARTPQRPMTFEERLTAAAKQEGLF